MKKFVRAVDAFNEFFGKYVALLILPLVFVVMYEVIRQESISISDDMGF